MRNSSACLFKEIFFRHMSCKNRSARTAPASRRDAENMNAPPPWLHAVAWISVIAAILSALWIAIDILRGRRQKMWIMNVVWPATGFATSYPVNWWLLRKGIKEAM